MKSDKGAFTVFNVCERLWASFYKMFKFLFNEVLYVHVFHLIVQKIFGLKFQFQASFKDFLTQISISGS